jgi:hypothetical protein
MATPTSGQVKDNCLVALTRTCQSNKKMAECHRRTRDLNHKITRIAIDWCIEHIGELVCLFF